MNARKPALLIVGGWLIMTGCQQPETAESPANESLTETQMTESSPARLTLDQAVSVAREDFHKRHQLAHEAIDLVDARPVTWRDGSIGCPEDGMMYTQALVDGYYIHLRADDQDAYYHAGRDGRPMHCPADRSHTPPPRSDQLM